LPPTTEDRNAGDGYSDGWNELTPAWASFS